MKQKYRLVLFWLLSLLSTQLIAQRIYQDDLSDYDPAKLWSSMNYTTDLRANDRIIQRIYSRGNDEGGRTEGSYETALMFVNLRAQQINANEYSIHVDVFANISTPEKSHAEGTKPYHIRAGQFFERTRGYQSLRTNPRQENASVFQFLDQEFLARMSRTNQIDARGQWIYARVAVGKINIQTAGSYKGDLFIQLKNQDSFVSIDEYHPSVKHKISWNLEINNQIIQSLDIQMTQPKVIAQDPHWLDQYLLELGKLEFAMNEWLVEEGFGGFKTRLPAK